MHEIMEKEDKKHAHNKAAKHNEGGKLTDSSKQQNMSFVSSYLTKHLSLPHFQPVKFT